MKILLIGPQGSGKSTQGKLLSGYLKIPVISTGDIFRQLATESSDLANRVKQTISEGKLVDDSTTSEIVQEKLDEEGYKNGFILDGYPRNIEQINNFDPGFDKVLYFNLPKEKSVQRLLNRGRADDSEDLINTRLDLYYQQTEPILEYYKNQGKLLEINADQDIDQVWEEVKNFL